MLNLVFSDFCCPLEVSCWPDDACAYSDPLLLPQCGLFSRKTIRWEQLELGHHVGAHLDTSFSPRADLTEVSLEVTFKVTSGERTCFEDSPLPSFDILAYRWIHALPNHVLGHVACMVVPIFLDWGSFPVCGKCELFHPFCRREL